MVDCILLQRKASGVERLLGDIDSKGQVSLHSFESNMDIQYYLLFCLEKAAQECLDLAGHVI